VTIKNYKVINSVKIKINLPELARIQSTRPGIP